MLLSLLSSGNLQQFFITLLLTFPVVVFALSLHETAHGYVAYKCGDPTAYQLGRLTLNPFKHLDPIGTLCMLVFGFGWAKPVPINTRNFRNPKRGMAISAAAGPMANLTLGVISAVLLGFFSAYYSYLHYTTEGFPLSFVYWVIQFCYISASCNFVFMVFNLIPVPPFDGSRIAFVFLKPQQYFSIMRYERQIMAGILIALFALDWMFDFSPFSWVASQLTWRIELPVSNFFWEKVFLPMLL